MERDASWTERIVEEHPNWEREEIIAAIGRADEFELQEGWKQNPYKISYYLRDRSQKDELLAHIREVVEKSDVSASIVWSVDPLQEVGLIDILPEHATKVGAIEFLRDRLGEPKENVVYAGDSGNDLSALTAGYKAIVVANAPEAVKEQVREKSEQHGYPYYIANGKEAGNGNYSSGILEGLKYYELVRSP